MDADFPRSIVQCRSPLYEPDETPAEIGGVLGGPSGMRLAQLAVFLTEPGQLRVQLLQVHEHCGGVALFRLVVL